MRLTVLGSSASYAGAGQACAGYLVEGAGSAIMVDCGNGALANLSCVADPTTLDAVIISHGHPDHFLDLYALQALLRYAPQGPVGPLALHAPAGLFERAQGLLSGRGAEQLAEAFDVHHLGDGVSFPVAGLLVTAHATRHTADSFAFEVEADGARLVYTGDSSPAKELVAIARGADLLLAEATLPERYAGAAPHMTARQAGELARSADVGQLVITHIWPTNDRTDAGAQAAAAYGGPAAVARELDAFEIRPMGRGKDKR